MENNEILNEEIIDNELVETEQPVDEEVDEQSSRDLLEEKIVSGKALIKYTEKIKEAIASSRSEVDISGVHDAIDSAKEDINTNIASLDENYQNLTEVYNLLVNKLDSIDDKLNLMFANVEEFKKSVPYKATLGEFIGYVSLINLLDLNNTFGPDYGTAFYCENLQESIEALREGRDLVISDNYNEIIYTSEEKVVDVVDPSETTKDSGNISMAAMELPNTPDEPIEVEIMEGVIPEGLPIVEYYHTLYGDYYISENLFIDNNSQYVPQSQVDAYDELYSIMDQFEDGEISFEEYMEQLSPYKHTMIIFSNNDSSSVPIAKGNSLGKYIVLTDVPKDQFVEGGGQK